MEEEIFSTPFSDMMQIIGAYYTWVLQWNFGRGWLADLINQTTISENKFGIMPGWSNIEDIFLRRQLEEKYKQKDIQLVFINLEKKKKNININIR